MSSVIGSRGTPFSCRVEADTTLAALNTRLQPGSVSLQRFARQDRRFARAAAAAIRRLCRDCG
jgi:hypothetical protein